MTVLQVAVIMFLLGVIIVTALNGSLRGNSKWWMFVSVVLVIAVTALLA